MDVPPGLGLSTTKQPAPGSEPEPEPETAIRIKVVLPASSGLVTPFSPAANRALRDLQKSLNLRKYEASAGLPEGALKLNLVDIQPVQ